MRRATLEKPWFKKRATSQKSLGTADVGQCKYVTTCKYNMCILLLYIYFLHYFDYGIIAYNHQTDLM